MRRIYQQGEASLAIRVLKACKRLREKPALGYLIALTCAIVGFLLQWYGDAFYSGAPFVTVYPAVVVAALLGGAIAGFFVAAVEGVAQWLFFIPSLHWVAVITYALDATVCVILIDFINRSFDVLLVLLQQQKSGAERQNLLNRELHHRIQNLFSVIQALVRFSFPERTAGRELLLDRIQAMSATNLAIIDSGSEGVFADRRDQQGDKEFCLAASGHRQQLSKCSA